MTRISSRQNPLVTRFRDAARRADPASRLVLDGEHLVTAALDAGVSLEVVLVSDGFTGSGSRLAATLLTRLRAAAVEVASATTAVMAAASPVRSPSGIVALASRSAPSPETLLQPAPPLVLVAVGIQDPGNLGAIFRAADAGGATGMVCTEGCADAFGWKALRGSMGSALRLPSWTQVPPAEVLSWLRRHALQIVATRPGAARTFEEVDLTQPTAVLLGAEGQGLAHHIEAGADGTAGIPMRDGVDSLNVAVTAALIVYEARRQRRPPVDRVHRGRPATPDR